ncbi:EAL domain-containing protein [Thermospira aquatica]|uniref:Bifunctional diguanylate cyclase/phosphodiesterase n=1 Tax=Thermospira aquatica TaxID=2828656 RepID=A0AAX3BI95_9SPIR|nr:bifunctional diguanylate cyclase/phosphodiesterase [Thermospira aquatica]URA11086.1 bifunctional diguanylate cyclase/phosphodiesterase [Thermospira aquatica]
MRRKLLYDLALSNWKTTIVSWIAFLMAGASFLFGLAFAFSLIPQASPINAAVGIISGISLFILGMFSILLTNNYQLIVSRLMLLWWTAYFFWHIFLFREGMEGAFLLFFAALSGLLFLLLPFVEGIFWHVGFFLVEGLLLLRRDHGHSTFLMMYQVGIAVFFGIYAWILDVSRRLLENRLYYDSVTGLFNRNYLLGILQQKKGFWLMIINVSNFKEFNDLFGYKLGDSILSQIALRLRSLETKYQNILLCHLHSDEFAIVGLQAWDRNLLSSLCEEIYVLLGEKPLSLRSLPPLRLHFHIGVSDRRDNLLGTADMAFRYAVSQGKLCALYEDKMYVAKSYEHNIRATLLLQDALDNDRIVPFFQPIVNLKTGKIEKYECLARIVDRGGRIYEPNFFLAIAQRNQLATAITRIMVKKCFDVFSKIDTEFSLNLSYQDLIDAETLVFIYSKLSSAPEVATRCIFEIVEETAIQDFRVVEEFITRVKEFGAKVALDDFGSGYSNFEYLVKLPFDYIKIDGILIERLPDDVRYQAVVTNIINFSRKIGSQTVAEFVSSEAIHEEIKKHDFNYGQGYYYGKPSQYPISSKDKYFS